MLKIHVPKTEMWDEYIQEFVSCDSQDLALEHSLVSISKWESKWHKPFLSKENKTDEEIRDYVRFMTLTQNVDPKIYRCLSKDNLKDIMEYIDNPMTATWFNEKGYNGKVNTYRRSGEQVTSELIYYWMVSLNIPFECQKWHLNRLLTLIKICNIKNQKPDKIGKKEILKSNAAINAARRQKLNTKG